MYQSVIISTSSNNLLSREIISKAADGEISFYIDRNLNRNQLLYKEASITSRYIRNVTI